MENSHSDAKRIAPWSTDIKQQLSDLLEQQAMRLELPKEGITSAAADCSDEKSIYIGNVDYETTVQELLENLSASGAVQRVIS